MDFLTGYLWQQGCPGKENRDSVLLQQVSCRGHNIVFGCVWGSDPAGGYFTGRLKGWFSDRMLPLAGKKRGWQEALRKELQALCGELAEHCGRRREPFAGGFAGILLVDSEFLLFTGGEDTRVYLINTRFGKAHLRRLSGEGGEMLSGSACRGLGCRMVSGRIQKGLGILLGTEGFFSGITGGMLKECLAVGEIERAGQIDRRLKELALAAAGDRCTESIPSQADRSAVYIKSM